METFKPQYSHSSLDLFRKCPMSFKFKYIDKLPSIENKEASDFGSVCHYIAEKYRGGGKEQLLKLYREMVPSEFKLTEKYKKKVPLALKNIHEHWKKELSKCKNIRREEEITVSLNDDINLTGKIDVIIETPNSHKIIDYKTSKSNRFSNHTNQLSMYMLLTNKKYNIPYDKMKVGVVYLALDPKDKYGKKILNEGFENISKEYEITESDVECLKNEIMAIHDKIQLYKNTASWTTNPTKFNCDYCGHKHLCNKRFLEEK